MGKLGRRALVLLVAALSMLVIASCGGDDDDSGGSSSGGGGTKGGTLNIDHTSYPDFLDPGLSYTVDGWEALHLAYTGLVTFANGNGDAGTEGAKVIPGLAKEMPKISDDVNLQFTLRDNLKFSDGTPVKASDFKHSIERLLEQDSQGAGLGYTTSREARSFSSEEGRRARHRHRRREGHHQDHAVRAARRVPV